ncbi:methylated-DNA--cysteine S-met [Hypoxylon rubiginosum]|uniref:Methylated-DNA--cysteine S-met n=1 Tax=Hypoxylon rubiginosum TaxID=110542 RepID=A0ACB9Z630_9PEZI|nr:methylated-DNA--cysteine S-met [Hypoxylon rubiginosum]
MAVGMKRKRGTDEIADTVIPPQRKSRKSTSESPTRAVSEKPTSVPEDMEPQLQRIAASNRTVFEKKVWNLLCQIPRGSISTYALLSAHLGSSPRAVGNALRRNPFAPQVPCHRVVATGGALGGFKGKWPRDGEGITIDEKRRLLREEGVKVDEKGRVLGTPWAAFV